MSRVDKSVDVVTSTLADKKACNVKVVDVRGKTSLTDYLIICHATSDAHSKTLADAVSKACKSEGIPLFGADAAASSEWKVLDFGDVIVHLFLEEARHFYDLESIWSASDPAAALARRTEPRAERRSIDARSLFERAVGSGRSKTRR